MSGNQEAKRRKEEVERKIEQHPRFHPMPEEDRIPEGTFLVTFISARPSKAQRKNPRKKKAEKRGDS